MHLVKIQNKSFANLASALKSKIKISEISEMPPLNEMIQALTANINHIEKGLTFLDYGLVISNIGTIDILACDSAGNLTIINIYNGQNISVECLTDSIKFVKWMNDHSHLLKKYYPTLKDCAKDSKIYILSASFTEDALNALDFIHKIKIELIEFLFLDMNTEEKYLLLNPVKSNVEDSYLKDNKIAPRPTFDIEKNISDSLLKQNTYKPFRKTILSDKELDEFFER